MFNVKNFAKTKVASGYNAVATSITVISGSKLPTAPFYATWWNATDYDAPDDDPQAEVIYVASKSGNTLSGIVRGADGTTAVAHNNSNKDYYLYAGLTATMIEQLQGSAPHGTSDPVDPPVDVDSVREYWNLTDRSYWIWDPLVQAWAKILGLLMLLGCLVLQGQAQPAYQRNPFTTNTSPNLWAPEIAVPGKVNASNYVTAARGATYKPVRLWVLSESLGWNAVAVNGLPSASMSSPSAIRGSGWLYHLTNKITGFYAVSNYAYSGAYASNFYGLSTNYIIRQLQPSIYQEVVLVGSCANDVISAQPGETAVDTVRWMTNTYKVLASNGAVVLAMTTPYVKLSYASSGIFAAGLWTRWTNADFINNRILADTNYHALLDANQIIDPRTSMDTVTKVHYSEGTYSIWADAIVKLMGILDTVSSGVYKMPSHYRGQFNTVLIRANEAGLPTCSTNVVPDGMIGYTMTGKAFIRQASGWKELATVDTFTITNYVLTTNTLNVTNYAYGTNYVYSTNFVMTTNMVTNYVTTTNLVATTNYVLTTNVSYTTNITYVTNVMEAVTNYDLVSIGTLELTNALNVSSGGTGTNGAGWIANMLLITDGTNSMKAAALGTGLSYDGSSVNSSGGGSGTNYGWHTNTYVGAGGTNLVINLALGPYQYCPLTNNAWITISNATSSQVSGTMLFIQDQQGTSNVLHDSFVINCSGCTMHTNDAADMSIGLNSNAVTLLEYRVIGNQLFWLSRYTNWNPLNIVVPESITNAAAVTNGSTLTNGLLAYYNLDETTGNRVDLLGGNPLTVFVSADYETGIITNAYKDRVNGSLHATSSAALQFGSGASWSFGLWANLYSAVSGGFACKGSTAGKYEMEIGYASVASSLQVMVYTNGDTVQAYFPTGDLATNTWYYVFTAWDNTAKELIIAYASTTNFLYWTTNSLPAGLQAPSDDIFEVGHGTGLGYLSGDIDEIQKWNRVLTYGEITNSWTAGKSGVSYPYTGY